MPPVRLAVVGAGQFVRNHLRVIRENARAQLAAVVDTGSGRAQAAAAEYGCAAHTDVEALFGNVDAAIVAVPTTAHADTGCRLLEAGIDVLVEKPIAPDLAGARRLVETASARGRILQVGHLERFNPAVTALAARVRLPLFFEIHRLSVFSPRSLDVDVILDLMIHDIDIVLAFTGALPEEIRAAGISILSGKVDIANARLAFPGGCVANFTASRVSTERVRKLRMFQPHQYLSLDYDKKALAVFSVSGSREIAFAAPPIERREPLALEVDAFLDAVERRTPPLVDGVAASRALEVALAILDRIEVHSRIVARTIAQGFQPGMTPEREPAEF